MGGFSIIMIKKEAVSHVECGDGSHIFVCQLKIGNVGVLLHPFYVNRLGDDDDAALDSPGQSDLYYAFPIFATDFGKYWIREETVTALGERSPRHDACAELFCGSVCWLNTCVSTWFTAGTISMLLVI